MRNPRTWIALAILVAMAAAPMPAAAQASRAGPTFMVGGSTSPVILPDVAYDSIHNRYLVVSGNGFIEGQLLDATGNRLAAMQVAAGIFAGGHSQTPRVAFSPDVNGGAGGYLVTWHESVGQIAQVRGKLISADGAALTGEIVIAVDAGAAGSGSNWTMGAAVAYSTGSREFLVAWMGGYFTFNDIRFMRLSAVGGLLQSTPTTITAATGDWERDPSVAYNPHQNEFYITYAGYLDAGGFGYVAGQRIQAGTGSLVGGPATFIQSLATLIPHVEYNPATQQYVVAWYNRSSGSAAFYGVTVRGSDGAVISGVRVVSTRYFAYDALDFSYNAGSGDFLLVTHGAGLQEYEDASVVINADGSPYDNGFILTNTPDVRPVVAGDGNFNPRIVASAATGRYLAVTASRFAAIHGQFATSSGTGGGGPPPPPPPPQCTYSINDSSASIGGGEFLGSVIITTNSGCAWTAASQASWIWISAESGSGGATVQWKAQPNNTGSARTGTLLIAGRTLSVYQAPLVVQRFADFNADSFMDIVWQNQSTGHLAVWRMNGFHFSSGESLTPAVVADTGWKVVAAIDIDRNGSTDLLWQHDQGWVAVWRMDGERLVSGELITQSPLSDLGWRIVGTGDFDRDGWTDFLWQHTGNGTVAVWYMQGTTYRSGQVIAQSLSDQNWRIVGSADMNGDNNNDIVWHHGVTGQVSIWVMSGTQLVDGFLVNNSAPDLNWRIRGLGDFDGDADVDVLWQNHSTGALAAWVMRGQLVDYGLMLSQSVPDTNWKIVAPR